jgi:hypothetical protein
MTEEPLKGNISPLSQEFTEEEITVDVMIYKIEGNDGWTLEVALDDETSVTWTELFPTDQEAWDEFTSAVAEVGLRQLLDTDDAEEATIH